MKATEIIQTQMMPSLFLMHLSYLLPNTSLNTWWYRPLNIRSSSDLKTVVNVSQATLALALILQWSSISGGAGRYVFDWLYMWLSMSMSMCMCSCFCLFGPFCAFFGTFVCVNVCVFVYLRVCLYMFVPMYSTSCSKVHKTRSNFAKWSQFSCHTLHVGLL